tara:strand:- start:2615 stop:3631 length:1017 start_codon:yes stop_codon:yes gene_type:complete
MANIPITGFGADNFSSYMGPGNPLNQNPINSFNFLNRYRQGIQPGGFNITGNVVDLGSKVTTGGGGGRALVNTAGTATLIPGIGSIGDWTANMAAKVKNSPWTQAIGETARETIAGAPGAVSKGAKGTVGLARGIASTIAPRATQEAIKASKLAGMTAAGTVLKGGGSVAQAQRAAKVAGIKAGGKIAGRWLGYRIPVAGAALDLAAGDPLGAAGTAIGGTIGAFAGGPVGATVGSMIGGPVLKGGRQILSPIFGDPNDPLSGRDWSIGGVPITPYAKTKRSMEKRAKLFADIQLPLMEKINNAQFQREMRMARLGMLQNMMSSTNSLMSTAYSTSSY